MLRVEGKERWIWDEIGRRGWVQGKEVWEVMGQADIGTGIQGQNGTRRKTMSTISGNF